MTIQATEFLTDMGGVGRLMHAVRYHAQEAFFLGPDQLVPDALVRDLVVDVVVLTAHFGVPTQAFLATACATAKQYIEAIGLGAVANLLDAAHDYASATRPSYRRSHALDTSPDHTLGPLKRRLVSGALPPLLLDVAMTAGVWRGQMRPNRKSVAGKPLMHEMVQAELRRARLAHMEYEAYSAALAQLDKDPCTASAAANPTPTLDTLCAAAKELFSLTDEGAKSFVAERLSMRAGIPLKGVTGQDVVTACTEALSLLGPQPSGLGMGKVFIETGHSLPSVSRPIADLADLLLVARERRRLFGEPVSLRYNNGMTAMTYVLRMLRLARDGIRLGATSEGRVVGFVSLVPLTKVGYNHLRNATQSVYAFVDKETVEATPGKAHTVLVQNFINRLEGIDLSTNRLAVDVLEDVVRRAGKHYVDPKAGGPVAVATGAHLAGQALLMAREFRCVGKTPHETPIFEFS